MTYRGVIDPETRFGHPKPAKRGPYARRSLLTGSDVAKLTVKPNGVKEKTAKPPKTYKCALRGCHNRFVKKSDLHNVCSSVCMLALVEQKKNKAARIAAKAERAALQARKEALKTRSEYLKRATAAFNGYIRVRDYGKPCASCPDLLRNQKYGGMVDCSHYRSVGSAPHLRFHLHNAAAACIKCNRYLGGNAAALRKGLIARIGIAKVEAVEANNRPRHFSIEYIIRFTKIFNRKTARAKKRIKARESMEAA